MMVLVLLPGPAHRAHHSVSLSNTQLPDRAVAQLHHRLAVLPQPLVGGRAGPRPVRVHAAYWKLDLLYLQTAA